MLATLTDLLAPVSLSEFLEAFRARTRLHISASDPTRTEALLSWQDIDALLSGHGLGENVGIWRNSVLVPRQVPAQAASESRGFMPVSLRAGKRIAARRRRGQGPVRMASTLPQKMGGGV